ncbi:MAG TPA: hypothetical protein VHB69_13610 [Mycobacteriales bacterium]|nr:hypothetical protein [Mycobacteriales bacterium]
MRRVLALLIASMAVLALGVVAPQTASALSSCPTPGATQVGGHWVPGDAETGGVEAPIQVRRDGQSCIGSSNYAGALAWIGIQGLYMQLVQIGIIRYYDTLMDTTRICFFWEILPAAPDPYSCGTSVPANDVFEYFRILRENGHYSLYDCGTSDPTYSACDGPFATEPYFASDLAEIEGENDADSCAVHLMGSMPPNGPDDPDNFGSSTNPVKIQANAGGTWGPKTLTADDVPACTYDSTLEDSSENVAVWDTANAS